MHKKALLAPAIEFNDADQYHAAEKIGPQHVADGVHESSSGNTLLISRWQRSNKETPELLGRFMGLVVISGSLCKFHSGLICGGLAFLQKSLEPYQILVHGLAWIDAKELRNRVTCHTCRRHIFHLDGHTRTAIPVFVEADKARAADL